MNQPTNADDLILRRALMALGEDEAVPVRSLDADRGWDDPPREAVGHRRATRGGARRATVSTPEVAPLGSRLEDPLESPLDPATAALATVPTTIDAAPDRRVDELEQRVAELLAERQSMVRRLAEGADELDELRRSTTAEPGDERLTQAHAEIDRLDRALAEARSAGQDHERRVRELEARVGDADREREASAGRDADVARLDSEIIRMRGELQEAGRQVSAAEREVVRLADELRVATRRADSAEQAGLETQGLSDQLREATRRADTAAQEVEVLRTVLGERDQTEGELSARLDRAEADLTRGQESARDLESRVSSLLRTLSDREDELNRAQDRLGDLDSLRRSLAHRDAEVTVLREAATEQDRHHAEEIRALQETLLAAEERHAAEVGAIVAEFEAVRRL